MALRPPREPLVAGSICCSLAQLRPRGLGSHLCSRCCSPTCSPTRSSPSPCSSLAAPACSDTSAATPGSLGASAAADVASTCDELGKLGLDKLQISQHDLRIEPTNPSAVQFFAATDPFVLAPDNADVTVAATAPAATASTSMGWGAQLMAVTGYATASARSY